MARLVLAACLVALILAIIVLILRLAQRTVGLSPEGPRNGGFAMQGIAYYLLWALIFGVSAGWLGGL